MMKKVVRAFLGLGLLCAMVSTVGAQSQNAADHDFTSVKTLALPMVTVGNAQLVRNDNGITCIIHTSGLVPGDVYSVWWVIPTEFLTFNATGGIAASDGTATFAGHASTGPIGPVDGSVVLSNGDGSFDSPRTDTITVIVRHHGPPIPGIVNQQMGSFNTGCGTGGCKNVQYATFLP
jgi:hypothetical protein